MCQGLLGWMKVPYVLKSKFTLASNLNKFHESIIFLVIMFQVLKVLSKANRDE